MEWIIAVCVLVVAGLAFAFMGGTNRKKKVLAVLEKARNNANSAIDQLEGLAAQYWVEGVVKDHRETMYRLALSEKDLDIDELIDLTRRYNSIATSIANVYLENPSLQLKKKFYDPLDDTVLQDPVDLEVTHPEKGKITLQVNSWNRDKYVKHGWNAFGRRQPSSYVQTHNYYVNYDDGGLDLIDLLILQQLFFSDSNGAMFADTTPFVGGGGAFDGGGSSDSYPDPNADTTDVSGPVAADDQMPIDQSVQPVEEMQAPPVIADPFADEGVSEAIATQAVVSEMATDQSAFDSQSISAPEPSAPESYETSGTSY